MLNFNIAVNGIDGRTLESMPRLFYIILTTLILFTFTAKGQNEKPRIHSEADDLDLRTDSVAVDTTRTLYANVRSNMLFDLAALPNVGAELYLGKGFSAGLNWMYAWWSCDSRHRYWRAYGGEIFGRWWFGSAADRKPLTGHHVGLYGQAFIYDFEWGGEGQMGGKPGGGFFDKPQLGIGVEYGYSLPVGRRINIDFSIGLGYVGGTYVKYEPIDNHYVYQSTHRRNYFGLTKLEVTFVWLIGHGNINRSKAKGGAR